MRAIRVDDAVDLRRVVAGILGRGHVGGKRLGGVQRRDDRPAQLQRVVIVLGEVVGDAGQPRVHIGAAELFGGDFLTGGGLDERRTAEKDGPRPLDDDRFVGHRRHVGAAGRAGAHHHRDLRDALRGHASLVEEDPSEVIAIGEDLGLKRQKCAA